VDEPFEGLFTQGMVVHETYRAADGAYLSPAEVRIESDASGRRAFRLTDGAAVQIGDIEKMSKSKRNTVDPDDIIGTYGADTARWFMLSDSPPERDVNWTEDGVQGAGRFVQRVWRLVGEIADLPTAAPGAASAEATEVRRAAHKALAGVGDDIERLRFNRCVAHIYELSNTLSLSLQKDRDRPGMAAALREAGSILVRMLAPMMPHLAESCWAELGEAGLVAEAPWPEVERALLVADSITYPVQVNGRKRDDLTVPADADNAAIERLVVELDGVRRALEGRAPKKIIIVPKRIVNVVG
jgi:leucyl-tRNA synthetase